jgi:hypothetical protein
MAQRYMMGRHPGTRTLSEYADRDLAPRRRARVAAHLAGCTACREIIHEWNTTAEILRESPSPGLSPDLFDRIQLRRAAGERAILPAAAPSGSRGSALLLAVAVAVALVVIGAAMFTTTSNLQADASELRIVPAEHGAGRIAAEYRAASSLNSYDRLMLWARYRTQNGKESDSDSRPIVVAKLTKAGDGIFRGSFQLPDSVMYALFAVERPEASRVYSGTRPNWKLLVYGSGGRSLLADPEQKVDGPVSRGQTLAYAATHSSADPYRERVHRWSQLQIRPGVDVRR